MISERAARPRGEVYTPVRPLGPVERAALARALRRRAARRRYCAWTGHCWHHAGPPHPPPRTRLDGTKRCCICARWEAA